MSRLRRRWLIGLAVVVVGGLVAGGAAIAALRGDDHGIDKQINRTFIDVTVNEDFLDVGPPAGDEETEFSPSPGDTFFFHDELWNRAETKKRGTLDGKCTFFVSEVDPETGFFGTAHCTATMWLAGGTVELAGGINFSDEGAPFFVAVVGGTKRYENVVGEAKLTEEFQGQENKSLLELELVPSYKPAK
jgi:hypothetical protein